MYNNQLAVAIKHNGKILRENKDVVALPFGSEFTVLVKNLSNRRVKFTLSIDGANALDNTEIVVNANSDTEIKRFIRSGNMDSGNAFKFIERTQAIEDGPRGIKIDDGIIRVEYYFEKAVIAQSQPASLWGFTMGNYGQTLINGAQPWCTAQASVVCAQSQLSDQGITVPGSVVEQKFGTVYGFTPESTSHVIVLRLVGVVGKVEVTKPITVNTKLKCVTCGRVNKATSSFCSECGTNLTLV